MNNFFSRVVDNRSAIVFFFLFMLGLATFSIQSLEISAVPDITNKQVMVNTKTGAYTPGQIEKIITYPIEVEMAGIPGVEEVRSLSKYGLSQVIIIFNDDVDIYFARQLVNQRLQKVTLEFPSGVRSELAPVSTGLGEIFMWTVSLSKDSPLAEKPEKEQLQYLRRLQDYKIKPALKKIKGVAEIDTNGGFNSEVHINFFPDKLNSYGLNTSDVILALENTGVSFGGGYIQKQGSQISVLASTKLESIDEIKNLPLKKMPSGQFIQISDIADVRIDHSLRVGAATTRGQETVLGTALMLVGSDSTAVINRIQEEIKHIHLPKDVELKVVYNRNFLVNKTIQTVRNNLFEGAALVIVILLLVLGHLRAAIIVSLAIPFSMLFAIVGMRFFGISANLMSLGAIDFGLLVDGSVVMVENYLRRLELEKGDVKNYWSLVISSCTEVSAPVINGLIIIMIVYVPIFALEGVEGKMFRPMAATVLLALVGSLIVAVFLIPILIGKFLKNKTTHAEPYLFRVLKRAYLPVLTFSFQYKKLILSLSGLSLIVAGLLFFRLGSDFVPQLDEGDLVIGLIRDSKQSIDESVAQQKLAEQIVLSFAEVDTVFSRLGTPESATDPMSPNFADTFVILKKDKSEWPKLDNGHHRTKEELFSAIRAKLQQELPHQEISSTQPIEMRFNEILEGSRADITMRIYGPDLEELLKYVTLARQKLKNIKGVESLEFDALTGLTKTDVLDIKISPKDSLDHGFNASIVNQQVAQSLSGQEVGYYFIEENIKAPIIFHLDESLRNNIDAIKALPLAHPNGGSIPLGNISDISIREQVTTIARSWAERYSALSLYISDRDISSVVQEARQIMEKEVKLGEDYRIEWGGQFKNLERAQAKLLIIVPLTLLIILFLIFRMTQSIVETLIIFLAIPLGLIGGVFALSLRSMNFSVSAAVGFIALSGIVILNSLVLVSFIKQKLNEVDSVDQAILDGAISRLRPVAMTALVASIGFLPMAIGQGMGAEVQRPLATVVIGGLVSSTLLTMVVIPIVLSYILKRK